MRKTKSENDALAQRTSALSPLPVAEGNCVLCEREGATSKASKSANITTSVLVLAFMLVWLDVRACACFELTPRTEECCQLAAQECG